jgi:hypothetical protein
MAVVVAGWWAGAVVQRPSPAAADIPVLVGSETEIVAHTAVRPTAFRLAANPRILVIDSPTLHAQGLMLNRIAAFVEKAGLPRDRVLGDAALQQAIAQTGETTETYYIGHDYAAADLARFFAAADRDRVALGAEEERLRSMLRREELLAAASVSAVLSVPRAAPGSIDDQTRRVILRHELSHGEFFANPSYAAFVRTFWHHRLSDGQRAAFRRFLQCQGYDGANEELMANEMQAFLMFTPDERYFAAGLVGLAQADLTSLRRQFLESMPAGWLRAEISDRRY